MDLREAIERVLAEVELRERHAVGSDADAYSAVADMLAVVLGGNTARIAEYGVAVDEDNRCGYCHAPLRTCCYTCPTGPHEDMCEGERDEE